MLLRGLAREATALRNAAPAAAGLAEGARAKTAQDIAAETGLEHQLMPDGQRVASIYRRSVMLASGRYAKLDAGMGFSLVPWKPVIEPRLGQQLLLRCRRRVMAFWLTTRTYGWLKTSRRTNCSLGNLRWLVDCLIGHL